MAASRTQNTRGRPRFPLDMAVSLVEFDERGMYARTFNGRIKDLSQGGLGICVAGMVHVGRFLLVEGELKGTRNQFFGRVVRNDYVASAGHIVGIAMEPLPKDGPVHLWLSQREESAA
ncbi:MAG: PilZ domain-containing protein [Planctomycetota bacterium]